MSSSTFTSNFSTISLESAFYLFAYMQAFRLYTINLSFMKNLGTEIINWTKETIVYCSQSNIVQTINPL
jgi:hypothetical protein